MPKFEWDLQQGSADWNKMRSEIPTASNFNSIITPKTMKLSEKRKAYAARIIAARLLNWQPDSLEYIRHIEEGKLNEPIAIGQLEILKKFETKKVGFVRTDDLRFGASPDRVVPINDEIVDVTIEQKCPTIPVHMEYLIYGTDDDYICQVQGQLFVCAADKAIFNSFHPRMPLFTVESGRNDTFLTRLEECLDQFSNELERLYDMAKSLGPYQEFERWLSATDAAYRAPTDADLQQAMDADYQWSG